MNHISKKLHSQSGASIILAMMLFLICGFVAAVTLSSAATNSKKYQNQRKEQQIYLSVSSAAWTLRNIISGIELSGTEKRDSYDCADVLNDTGMWRNVTPPPEDPQNQPYLDPDMASLNRLYIRRGDGKIAEMLAKGAYNSYLSNTAFVPSKEFHLWKKTLTISADNMYPVQVEITMEKDYSMTISLKAIPDNVITDQYSMILYFQGNPKTSGPPDSTPTCFHEGERYNDHEYTSPTWDHDSYTPNYTHSEKNTTLTWKETSLRKGGSGS